MEVYNCDSIVIPAVTKYSIDARISIITFEGTQHEPTLHHN